MLYSVAIRCLSDSFYMFSGCEYHEDREQNKKLFPLHRFSVSHLVPKASPCNECDTGQSLMFPPEKEISLRTARSAKKQLAHNNYKQLWAIRPSADMQGAVATMTTPYSMTIAALRLD